ncbi:MAG: CHASE2 domain-containing protein [Oscillatoriales cyanobacterium]|nr:MAG: CHASE2 domain-containing protein [Oscillatoriales cyanobacterium]
MQQWSRWRAQQLFRHSRHLADWAIVATIAGGLLLARGLGWLQQAELAAYDWLTIARSPLPPSDQVVIVGVDEPDIQILGNWPASDQDLSQLLSRLVAAEPAAIGLDIYRDFSIGRGQLALNRLLSQEKVPIVGITLIPDAEKKGVNPPPALAQSDRAGFNNIIVDPDGRIRRHVLYWWTTDPKTGQRVMHRNFALILAQLYLQKRHQIELQVTDRPEQLQLGRLRLSPLKANSGGYSGIDAAGYQVLADWRGPAGTTPVVWWRDVVAGRVPPERLRGRIVLIGAMTESLKDYAYTPYSSQGQASAQPVFGVELQAQAIEQLLDSALNGRSPMRTWPDWSEGLWVVLWIAVAARVVQSRRSIWRVVGKLLLAIGAMGAITVGSFLGGWWIPLVPTGMGMLLGAGSLAIATLQRQREQIRSTVFFQQVLEAIPEPIFVKDCDQRWIAVNSAFCSFVGLGASQLVGRTAHEVLPPDLAQAIAQEDERALTHPGPWENQLAWPDAFGRDRTVATKRTVHCDRANNRFLVGVIRDITEQQRAEAELRRTAAELRDYTEQLELAHDVLQYQARHDGLTGMVNRKYFYERLTFALKQSCEESFVGAILYLDLDGFKAVNDTLGHRAGDLLLIECAQRLTQNLRGSDTIARFGGDEFVALLPAIPQAEVAACVAQKLLNAVSKPYCIEGQTCQVTVSIGIALFPSDGTSSDRLVEYADTAMFAAKGLGKNAFCLYSELPALQTDLVPQR